MKKQLNDSHFSRRRLLRTGLVLAGSGLLSESMFLRAAETDRPAIGVNGYACGNLYDRDGKKFMDHLDEIKAAGFADIEVSFSNPEQVESTVRRFKEAGLALRSYSVGPDFFSDPAKLETECNRLMETAEAAHRHGAEVVMSNPAIKAGKSDEEIRRQTAGYAEFGRRLSGLGLKLAVHYHTTEWQFGGREILHLMSGTKPEEVGLCFDTHWSYRACGNSTAAVEAHMKLWADRIVEFHFRQSNNHCWSETFGDGDIDHAAIIAFFRRRGSGTMPRIVLEQCAEKGTPQTLPAGEVLRKSTDYLRKILEQHPST